MMDNGSAGVGLRGWESIPAQVSLVGYEEFLRGVMTPGVWHLRSDIVALAEADGLHVARLGQARKRLGVLTASGPDPDGVRRHASYWKLDEGGDAR